MQKCSGLLQLTYVCLVRVEEQLLIKPSMFQTTSNKCFVSPLWLELLNIKPVRSLLAEEGGHTNIHLSLVLNELKVETLIIANTNMGCCVNVFNNQLKSLGLLSLPCMKYYHHDSSYTGNTKYVKVNQH